MPGDPLLVVRLARAESDGMVGAMKITVSAGSKFFYIFLEGELVSRIPIEKTDTNVRLPKQVALLDKYLDNLDGLSGMGYLVTHFEYYISTYHAAITDMFELCKKKPQAPGAVYRLVRLPDLMEQLQEMDDVQIPVTPPVRVMSKRLSKEEWLKEHYPEMSELPKWRFPGLAG
jgi:hypothetical protein